MSANELPPEEDPDLPDKGSEDDGIEIEQWDMSEQLQRGTDDGPELRDEMDPDAGAFGELSDEDENDRFKVSGSVDGFLAEDEAEVAPAREVPARELESVLAAGPLDIWPTRHEREAEIMGYPQDADYDDVEQGRKNAEAQTITQLSGVYELAGFLHGSSEGQQAAVTASDTEDDARTWFTPTGRVSVHQHRDFNYEDQSVRTRLPDKNEDQSAFGVLEVQAQELVPYNDAGDIVEVTVRVTYETVENGSVYWKGMQTGFTKPEDGAPCPEGEEALLGTVDPEALPPGVTLNQAIENKLLGYVWTNTREVFEGVADEVDEDETAAAAEDVAADALADEVETEQAEGERNTTSIRNQAIREAGQHLYNYEHSESSGYESFTAGRAYVDLAELSGHTDNAELVAGYTERLEQVNGVPATYLVRAYFAGSDAGDPEMLTKLDTLLTGEMIDRMKSDDDPYGLVGMAALQQAVIEYEARGISPDTLIADKTLSAEERWVQTLYHQSRTRGADSGAADRLKHTIQQLAYNEGGRFTPAFVMEMASSTLRMCTDPDDRAQLVEQFTDAIDRVAPSATTFRALRNVGNQVLQDKELVGKGLVYPLNTRITMQSEQIRGSEAVFNGRREWDVTFMAHSDLSASELVEKIHESTGIILGRSTDEKSQAAIVNAHNSLLRTGAEAYASQGKFVQSRELIAAMGMGDQANAYEACLRSAKSPIDVQRLRPPVDTETQTYDPDIAMLFEANEVRVRNDASAMTAAVYKLADNIAKAGHGDKESSLPDPVRCRDQAVELLDAMRSTHPGSELPAARALLLGMRQSATYGSSLSTMALTFSSLAAYGSSDDHELLFQTIRDTPATDAKKAEEYARLALRLTQAA